MPLIQHEQATDDTRYDAETLRKVTALAQRLQAERQETLTAAEMEQIGAEVGLQSGVIREALAKVTAPKAERNIVRRQTQPMRRALVWAWWAAGWLLPIIVVGLLAQVGKEASIVSMLICWAVYIAGGIILNGWRREGEACGQPPVPISRHDLLDAFFTLQHVLEGQREHRAFLSVDVAGSSEMKRGEPELAAEYSFGQFQQWISETVRAFGGEVHSAAGDGAMCVFREDAAALRAARALQEGAATFNARHNRLARPFRLRCGVAAGEVAVDPQVSIGRMHSPIIDRAAHLQKDAASGDIVVSGELAAAALVELGRLAPKAGPADGGPVFSWIAADGASAT